jgi:predicted amidohydrolase
MSAWWLAAMAGVVTGAGIFGGRRAPWLGWVALAPLGAVVALGTPAHAALAGAVAGALAGGAPVWDRTMRRIIPMAVGLGAVTWAGAFAVATWVVPADAPEWLVVALPVTTVAVLLPPRWVGAPRWASNPIACTQERVLTVVHAARLGGDLLIAALLGVSAAALVLVALALVGETVAHEAIVVPVLLVASALAYGAWRFRAAVRRMEASPSVRLAAVVVDGPPPAGAAPTGVWPLESPAYRDVEATVRRYEPHVARAVREGAAIVVLPEVGVFVDASSRARWIDAVRAWAREHKVAIVAPYFEGSVPKNELVVVDEGGVVTRYEKQHPARGLEPAREERMTPGPHAVRAGGRTIPLSAVLCVDLDYPDLLAPVRAAGGVLAVPSNDWPGGFDLMHHETAVWSAAMAGVTTVRATGHGISAVFDGAGRVLAQRSSAHGPVVLVTDAPLSAPTQGVTASAS